MDADSGAGTRRNDLFFAESLCPEENRIADGFKGKE